MVQNEKNNIDLFIQQILIFTATTPLINMALFLLSKTLWLKDNEINVIGLFAYILVFISGLIFSFVIGIFVKEKNKSWFYFTFIFFYMVFELLLCFFTKNVYLPYVILPLSIIHFILQAVLNSTFVTHGVFIKHWNGKSGKELETLLYHENIEAQELAASIKSFKTALIVMSVFYFIFMIAVRIAEFKINLFMIINTVFFMFSIFYFFFYISYFNREAFYANMGFDVLVKDKKSFFRTVTLIFLLSLFMGTVLSKETPWIKLKLHKENSNVPVSYVEQYSGFDNEFQEFDFDNEFFDLDIHVVKESKLPKIAGYIIKFVCILILVLVLLYFTIFPFFTSGWKEFWKEKRIFKYFQKIIDNIKELFLFLFSKNTESFATVEAKTFKNSISDFVKKSKKSKEKKQELDRLTKQFVLLIQWASKYEIYYKSNLAPAEYTQLIYKNLFIENVNYSNFNPSILQIGLLFEKALYDKNLLSQEEESIYSKAIKDIITIRDLK